MKHQRRNIELLLIALVFIGIVGLSIGITLVLSSDEGDGENTTSDNLETIKTNQSVNTPPIHAIEPANNSETKDVIIPAKTVLNTVPFTSQAPTGMWSDERQQNACEEASALMAQWWLKGEKPTSAEDAQKQILAVASYEEATYGNSNDTDPGDTVTRIFEGYFHTTKAKAFENISLQDIVQEIMKGHLVILPMDGIKLANPHYTAPGPERHMLLIIGYDAKTKEFVTNDSGTRYGAGYRYPETQVFNAIREYPTGNHLPLTGTAKKSMIVVSK